MNSRTYKIFLDNGNCDWLVWEPEVNLNDPEELWCVIDQVIAVLYYDEAMGIG